MALSDVQVRQVGIRVQEGIRVLREELIGAIRSGNDTLRAETELVNEYAKSIAEAHKGDVVKLQLKSDADMAALAMVMDDVDIRAVANVNKMKEVGEQFELTNSLALESLEGLIMIH